MEPPAKLLAPIGYGVQKWHSVKNIERLCQDSTEPTSTEIPSSAPLSQSTVKFNGIFHDRFLIVPPSFVEIQLVVPAYCCQ